MRQYQSFLSVGSGKKSFKFFFTLFPLIIFSFFLIFSGQDGHCSQVTLTWDPNSESDLAGYNIYYGTASGDYQAPIDVGNITTYTLNGLVSGGTYYIAATAYNIQGVESGFSNEVVYSVPGCTYTISPSSASFAASGGSGSVVVTTQAGCNWITSNPASWVTVTSGTGTGSGTMSYSVSNNPGTASRMAGLTIAGNIFSITEAGVPSYTITTSAGPGGLISPSGGVNVLLGANQTFTITPNYGYRISGVSVDGVSQGEITSYTFSSVNANHTISATFSTVPYYTLAIGKTGTGDGAISVNPSGTSFPTGTQITLNANPDLNSEFTGWSGACSGSTPTCLLMITSDLNVTADFLSVSSSPIVITGSAKALSSISATLYGTVNPYGVSTVYFFEWGSTTAYGNATALHQAGSIQGDVPVSENITGLTSNTVYHYRLVAVNSAGTTNGVDRTFISQFSNQVDFNGDGKTDLLWRHKDTGTIATWYMNGTTPSGSALIAAGTDINWEIVGTGDFNSNGKTDLLWRHKQAGAIATWYMNGTTPSGSALIAAGTDINWEIVGTGDFNSDGKMDLLWRHKQAGAIASWYLNGTTPSGSAMIASGTDINWEIVGTGDFNNDGKTDLLWRHKQAGAIASWYMNGVTPSGSALIAAGTDINWEIVGTGDFNNDGKTDLLWRHKQAGAIATWYMNGVTPSGSALIAPGTDINWKIVAP